MKNTNIKNLDKVIPKRIRFSVYKKALKIYEENLKKPTHYYTIFDNENDGELGLCLLLPCVMWDLKDYLVDVPYDMHWFYPETTYAFPEIAKGVEVIKATKEQNKLKLRIKVLKDILKKEANEKV